MYDQHVRYMYMVKAVMFRCSFKIAWTSFCFVFIFRFSYVAVMAIYCFSLPRVGVVVCVVPMLKVLFFAVFFVLLRLYL